MKTKLLYGSYLFLRPLLLGQMALLCEVSRTREFLPVASTENLGEAELSEPAHSPVTSNSFHHFPGVW